MCTFCVGFVWLSHNPHKTYTQVKHKPYTKPTHFSQEVWEKVSLCQDDDISKFTVIDLSKEDDEEDDVSDVTTTNPGNPTPPETQSRRRTYSTGSRIEKVSWIV